MIHDFSGENKQSGNVIRIVQMKKLLAELLKYTKIDTDERMYHGHYLLDTGIFVERYSAAQTAS